MREWFNELNFYRRESVGIYYPARFGSFSKAAEELGLTTSALATPSSEWKQGWMWCCSLAVPKH